MSLHGGSVFSRLSKRSAIRDTSQLAVHLSNDNAMRRLLRDGVGINEVQQKYLSLCYSARPAVRPNKDVAQGLAAGELVWNLTVCEKRETSVVASLLTTKEARRELRSLVISANEAGCSSVRMRASMAKRTTRRGSAGLGGGGTREMSMEKDPVGQMELFVALCKALPQLGALRSLELDGLKQAFEKSGAGAARLARGLAGNSKLKSLSVKRIRLVTGAAGATGGTPDNSTRGLGALASAIGGHPSLVALSLGGCGLSGEPSGRLVASVIRAHAARREGMVWSSGLRRPPGVVGHTAAAAPRRISTAGCLAVDLSGNRLGDAGVHAVARGLQSDTWLLGLNLADNGITDRGAALLSVCLQHNATLCALVLDGNPEIGRDAERRITQELETRSTMPEAVLEEPEVVLTLASWGFSAHAGFEGDPPPPPPPDAAGSDSAVSEISQDDFGGGDGLSAVNTPAGRPKTPAERKEEMVREFRRWAGYTSHQPVQVPAPEPAADAGSGPEGMAGRSRARGRSPSISVLLREEESRYTAAAPPQAAAGRHSTRREVEHQQKGAAGAGDRAHARAHARGRARSLSSRSSRLAPADSDGGGSSNSIGDGRRSAKRSKSSGPFGRGARGAGAATATATGRARTVRQQVPPWGAGPRNGQVRERMQAWASAHLAVGGSRGSRSGRRRRVRARTVHAGASGFGGVGGGGGRKARRRSAKGTAAGSRRAAKLPDSGVAVPARRERSERARRGPAALDVTWDVLDAQGYPELTPRQRRKLFPASPADADEEDEPAVFSPGVGARGGGNNGGGGGGGGGRTDRVVEMLASLEKAVMDVCKDMWRLEDKVEGSERLTASGGSGQPRECSVATDQASGRREGEGRVASDDLDVGDDGDLDFDGRDEVAAQVEACLREMWDSRAMADRASADGHVSVDDGAAAAAGGADDGTGRNTTAASSGGGDVETAASAGSGAGEDEDEEDNGFRTHAALLLEGGFGGGGGGKCSGRMDSGSGSGTENPAASRRSELPERAAGAGRSHQQVQRDEMKEAEQSLLYGMCAVDEEEEEGEEKEGKEDQVPGVGVAFEAESSAPGAGAGWQAPTLGDQDRGGGQDRRRGEGAPSEEESVESEEENGGEEADGDGGGASSAARRRRGVGDFVDMAAPPSPSMDDLLFVEDLVGLGEEGGKDGGSEGSEGEDED